MQFPQNELLAQFDAQSSCPGELAEKPTFQENTNIQTVRNELNLKLGGTHEFEIRSS
jgi:hypothetical protein